MVQVRLPKHLLRFVEAPTKCEADGVSVAEVVTDLERQFPGLAAYLIHENGNLRQHVNIFLDEKHVTDRAGLSDPVDGVSEIVIMQALSGG